MNENWQPYICNVNGSLASIFVNLSLHNQAPVASKPHLLWVWVYFRSPRPDGLSDSAEAPTLYKIEDALKSAVDRACKAILSGRITTEGRREFYFYGETSKGFSDAITREISEFEGYSCDFGEKEDPRWSQYFDVLYPSADDLERIKNRDLLDVLNKHGDNHSVPRDVQHWIYFPSTKSRDLFKEQALKAGFQIVSVSDAKGARPFGISISRKQSVEQSVIDATALELLHMALRLEGEYDGWETPIMKDS
jgi:uncharacterized protein (TIGR01619 family)